MDKELETLLEAAKAAAVATHRAGYKLEWVSFQQGNDDGEIEVGIRVSKDVMVSIVDQRKVEACESFVMDMDDSNICGRCGESLLDHAPRSGSI